MCGKDKETRPDLGASLENWRSPMPVGRKLRLLARNNLIKLRTRSSCCGNFGEPGC